MKFFQTALLLAVMVSVVSTVAAQTPLPVKKACCAPGSTTDAAGKKCDPKACAPQTGSAKACCAPGSTTDAAGKKCDPKACTPQKGSAKACCAPGSTTDAVGKKCDPKACAPQTGSTKACCAPASGSASSNTTAYAPKEFKKQFKQAKNKILLDVRTPEEFAEGHLKNAQNMDYLNDNFEKEVQKLDKTKSYYLYCRGGQRTSGAAEIMQKLGFEKIYLMDGGLLAWEALKLPIVK